MNEYLISKLKEGRINKGLKQSDVAVKIGVKGNTLSNYENGVSEPDIDTFCALCDIYGLDAADLLGEAYGLGVQGSDFSIKPSEIEYIKKYRSLDEHGKKMVDFVISEEFNRCGDESSDNGFVYISKDAKEDNREYPPQPDTYVEHAAAIEAVRRAEAERIRRESKSIG